MGNTISSDSNGSGLIKGTSCFPTKLKSICSKVVERNTFNPLPVMLTQPASFNICRLFTESILLKILSISSSDSLADRLFSISLKSNTFQSIDDSIAYLFVASIENYWSSSIEQKVQQTVWLNNLIRPLIYHREDQ